MHRDIKPANLLFGSDGRLRVADFGLARAIAEAGWTEPAGAVLGTARYASPEQARGESLDGRSDVYSLALVMVEAVTGEVPFTADTTIGTLMARLDHSLEVPDELGPLAPIVAGAGRLDPNDRVDAAAFGQGLVGAATQLRRPEPLPLTGTGEPDVAPTDERDTTLLGPTAGRPAVRDGGRRARWRARPPPAVPPPWSSGWCPGPRPRPPPQKPPTSWAPCHPARPARRRRRPARGTRAGWSPAAGCRRATAASAGSCWGRWWWPPR